MIAEILYYIISFILALPVLYFLQVKEYTYITARSTLHEWKLSKLLWGIPFNRPKVSARNIASLLITLLLSLAYFYYLDGIEFTIAYFFVVKLFIILAVAVTAPASILLDKRRINKARQKMNDLDTEVIPLTGSYAKSSVRHYLVELLSSKYKVATNPGNLNSRVGVAITINNSLSKDDEYLVIETAADLFDSPNDGVKKMFNYKTAVITGINAQHSAIWGSLEAVIELKSRLISNMDRGGTLYINEDCPNCMKALEIADTTDITVVKYSLEQVEILEQKDGLTRFEYDGMIFETSLPGTHSVLNLLPGILISKKLGMKMNEISKVIYELRPLPHKLEIREGVNNAKFIDDSYSSNEDGFIAAIEYLQTFSAPNKFLITNGLKEMKDKTSAYQRVSSRLGKTDIKLLSMDEDLGGEFFGDEDMLFNYLKNNVRGNDVVLVEGRFPAKFISKIFE